MTKFSSYVFLFLGAVRRFLEKYGAQVQRIVFIVVDEDEVNDLLNSE